MEDVSQERTTLTVRQNVNRLAQILKDLESVSYPMNLDHVMAATMNGTLTW